MTRCLAALLAVILVCVGGADAADRVVPLAQPGAWSGVSSLIGYGDRVWFVNSVKFIDHNSADIYSYDPRQGTTRYEAHLFSQDAGDPVVAGGLLDWPFEDPRFSARQGEYVVTNGREWQWRVVSGSEAFHVHAMAAHGRTLYAATSAWRATLQRSDDEGQTWRVVYDHPSTPGLVSRVTALGFLDGVLYAGVTTLGDDGVKLLRMAGDTLRAVPGWPPGTSVSTLTPYRGWLYAVTATSKGPAVWRTDGTRVEHVGGLDGQHVRARAADVDALWAVSAAHRTGTLWRSHDGVSWSAEQAFRDAEPLDVALYAGRLYVGTIGPDERGTLWGPPPPAPTATPVAARLLPRPPDSLAPDDVARALRTLDVALADSRSYADGATPLRAALAALTGSHLPEVGVALARRLEGPFPVARVTLFGGALTITATELARWHLLRAMALNGHGRVPLSLLTSPWTARPNRAEKYLEPAPAAAWTAAQLGQRDDDTLGALIGQLERADHPVWLDGDFVGALTVLTGERFGYDHAAWRAWWARRLSRGR